MVRKILIEFFSKLIIILIAFWYFGGLVYENIIEQEKEVELKDDKSENLSIDSLIKIEDLNKILEDTATTNHPTDRIQ